MSLDKFIRLADGIVEFEADLNDNKYPIASSHAIEVHRCELKSSWNSIKEIYQQFIYEVEKEVRDPDDPLDIETFKAKYKNTYVTYCRCLTKLSEMSDDLQLQSTSRRAMSLHSVDAERPVAAPSVSQGLHLPPIEIESFHDDYASWPTFRDTFTAVVSQSRASNVEKLFYLTQKTKGEAREIVQKSPLTNEGFEIAWKNLCLRFENRRVLVNGQLKILFSLQAISTESAKALKELQRNINSCMSILGLYRVDISSWDPIFVFICTNKLPENTLTLWEQQLKDKTTIPSWSELDEFLTNRYRTLESVKEIRNSNTYSSKINDTKSKSQFNSNSKKQVHSFQTNVSGPKCQLCPKENHAIRKCPRFLNMDYNQRINEIRKEGLCLNCFSKTHSVRNCSSKHSCYKCNKRHNTLLHKETSKLHSTHNSNLNPNSPPFIGNQQPVNSVNSEVIQSCFATNSRNVLLGTAMINILNKGVRYRARALIDSGSEGTFISERLFNLLRLPFEKTNAQISGLNSSISATIQKQCGFLLGTELDDSISIPVKALVVPHLSSNLPAHPLPTSSFANLPDIRLADPNFYSSSKIDVLIGADIFPYVICSGLKKRICDSLIAQETIFGWILTGPIFCRSTSAVNLVSYFCEISLDKEISRFWEVENLPKKNIVSSADRACEDLYVKTTTRNSEGRYIVSLPFKEGFQDSLNIGNSRPGAMAQFLRNEARLIRNPELKLQYDKVVQEYEELGHMIKVLSPSKFQKPECYYLPHHAVIKPDSATTKVRVVFTSSNGLSLNSLLHTGPVLQNDLMLIILKWRFFRYVYNADIQKMYRQILINQKHTPYQRILFRDDPNRPLQDYELQTVTFGVNCAPYLAIRTLFQLADDVQSIYPTASSIIRKSVYVDDVLAGAHSKAESINDKNELILALQSAGFSLRKWTSNCKDILADVPRDYLLHENFLKFEDSSTAKTLGIRWNACSDEFFFVPAQLQKTTYYTKREVLSKIAKLFDPAGWLSPCVILAKVLMQKIWMDKTEWDEILCPETLRQWQSFEASYSAIKSIRIPRWINYIPSAKVQFHGFCDASERAYAAALYIRIVTTNSVHTHLIASKTKVAPIKTLSIPRLELCGAVLLAEMIESLLSQLDVASYNTFCWTDSTVVLSWLAKPACKWLTFVANRVSKITQILEFSCWNHVSSDANPADLASRGLYPEYLVDNDLWWFGPKWLSDTPEKWPAYDFSNFSNEEIEVKPVRVHFSYFSDFEDLLERFSSFSKAIRVMAYVYRFFNRTHRKTRFNFHMDSVTLSNSEIVSTLDRLISVCQKAAYPNEYKALSSKQEISKSSCILNLNPFLDSKGIIRSCGRLENSPGLSYNERHPIIIPYNCQYSRLLVQLIHDISLHGGNQLVLRLLRMQYWIPKAKNLIKAIANKCKPCLIYKKKCQKQIMAALPPERSSISRPFTCTGLDFAGPFDIKSYSGRTCKITKGYVCIFVCFSTKAIHLEATSDLSTPVFLSAFSRFVSRRGCPLHLHSDNGTTFIGASKTLAKEFIQESQQRILASYSLQNINWHFIPPGAPHMGGLWEAGVKSFKAHFRKIAGCHKYTYEELSTLLAKIEACLNSRPISPMTTDPTDLCALTPGHFLIGAPILAPADPRVHESISVANRWQRVKIIHQNFCDRWKNEYLKELHKRVRWKQPERNVQEGDLVVVKDENLPPNSWRLGRVQKIYIGSDRRVRVADVLTQRGVVTRPIVKLVVLLTPS